MIKLLLSTPAVWVLLLLVIGLALTRRAARTAGMRVGWYCLLGATILLYVLSTGAFSNALISSLEKPFITVTAEDLNRVEVVVVLGGGTLRAGGPGGRSEPVGTTWLRLSGGVEYFNRSGALLLVLSDNAAGAEVMRLHAMRLGVPPEKILLEGGSINTYDQARLSRKLLGPGEGPVVGLATSALHMKRSLWSFNRYFNDVVPLATNFSHSPRKQGLSLTDFVPTAGGLSATTDALHEVIGMIWYRTK